MIKNNPGGSKSIRQIKYPADDTVLRFTSKDHIGEITLDNITGYFKFEPGLAPEELEGYVTLETVQEITGEKSFDTTTVKFTGGTSLKWSDFVDNGMSSPQEIVCELRNGTSVNPGDNKGRLLLNDKAIFTEDTLKGGTGITIEQAMGAASYTYTISTNALQYVDLETVYGPNSITVSTDEMGGYFTEIHSATTSVAGVMSAADKQSIGVLKTNGEGSKYLNDKGEYLEVLPYVSGPISKFNTANNEVVLCKVSMVLGDSLNEHIIVDSSYGSFDIALSIRDANIYVSVRQTITNNIHTPAIYVNREYDNGINLEVKYHSGTGTSEDEVKYKVLNSEAPSGSGFLIERGNAFINSSANNESHITVWDSATAPLVATLTDLGTGSNVLADNGTYVDISGLGGGDMAKATYDPTSINASAFDYTNFINTPTIPATTDNLPEGGSNLYFQNSRVTANPEVTLNTYARHSHANKTLLDALTSSGGGNKYLNDAGNYVAVSAGSGSADWGSIGGIIANQIDLNQAFPAKASTATISGTRWTFLHDITVSGNIDNWFFDLWEWDGLNNVLKCKHNLSASGEITAFAEANPPDVNWWNSMPLATNISNGGIKAQTTFTNGIRIGAGGFLEVDPSYSTSGDVDQTLTYAHPNLTITGSGGNTVTLTHTHAITEVDTLSDALTNRPTRSGNSYITGNWIFGNGLTISNGANITGGLVSENNIHAYEDVVVEGNITAEGEITAFYASDKRLKQGVKTIDNGLNIVENLRPVEFNWNTKAVELNNNKETISLQAGLIAQEVEEVLPNIVGSMYVDYKSLDYVQLIPYLINAVQELSKEVKELKRRGDE